MNFLGKGTKKILNSELKISKTSNLIEVGIDESGAGCLAGDVIAAAVIWPNDQSYFEQFTEFEEPDSILKNYEYNLIRTRGDSKKLTEIQRNKLKLFIENYAIDYSIGSASVQEIDSINILHARILAMNRAIKKLIVKPELILVDGNYFYLTEENLNKSEEKFKYETVEKGDSIYQSIACASILAKTERDKHITELHKKYPMFNWEKNKSYGTKEHYNVLKLSGPTEYHRKSFNLSGEKTKCLF